MGSLRQRRPPARLAACVARCVTLAACALASAAGAAPGPVVLRDRLGAVDPWPAVTLLGDPGGALDVDGALGRLAEFRPPAGLHANLGVRRDAVWLAVALEVPAGESGAWILHADYASLDRVDVFLVAGGRVVERHALGDHVAFRAREMPTAAHAAALQLPPGAAALLLLRVQTTSSMIVPLTLERPEVFRAGESRTQVLQGLLAGLGLGLLLYSLLQWLALRDRLFLYYALTVSGTTLFFFAFFGLAPQHLWPDSEWLTRNAAPALVLLALTGGAFFIDRALAVHEIELWLSRLLRGVGWAALASCLAFAAGVTDYRVAQASGTLLGPLPVFLAVRAAWLRWRRGDRAARYVFVGWGGYFVGVAVMAALLRGFAPANFWTQHAFQFGAIFEMLLWLLVLGVRVDEIRRAGQQARRERETLQSLADTDALTGLLNRRGLEAALPPVLAAATPSSPAALYLLDLDGFKQVNDAHGHATGDALLALVAQRLRAQVRGTDLLARLGGDEFVVLLKNLPGEADAERLAAKLLAAFDVPFLASGQRCEVGLTIGYALAPHDGREAAALLARADAAMYAGKQAGKRRYRRGDAALPATG